MPQQPSERIEEKVRQYLADNLQPTELHGYDPRQTNPSSTDYLPVTCDWSKRGSTYPLIFVGEQSGPALPNSGNTNSNGMQGDGSGSNQTAVHTITISVQTMEGGAYLDSMDYDDLAHDLYWEVHSVLQSAAPDAIDEALFSGVPTPPTPSRNPDTGGSDTDTWFQASGTVPVGYLYSP